MTSAAIPTERTAAASTAATIAAACSAGASGSSVSCPRRAPSWAAASGRRRTSSGAKRGAAASLTPFHPSPRCDPVTTRSPARPLRRAASFAAGVEVTPRSTRSDPVARIAARAASARSALVARPSRARAIAPSRPRPRSSSTNAAAHCPTTSPVRSDPTRPRSPECVAINPPVEIARLIAARGSGSCR